MKVGIVDYGAGNLKSVSLALKHLGYNYLLVQDEKSFNHVDILIIPGVGAFSIAMEQLNNLNLTQAICHFATTGKKMLGICLGMQLFFSKSYELCETDGLNLISGVVKEIPRRGSNGQEHKVPHVGWNELISTNVNNNLFSMHDSVYFVHSYMAEIQNYREVLAYSEYNGIMIPSLVQKNNILGCQFHPEKSGKVGLILLKKILEL